MPTHSAASGTAGSVTAKEAPRASSDGADVEPMSDSTLIPAEWLAEAGRTTPAGVPATYRSSIHALMALRLRYRRDVLHETNAELETARDRYQASWDDRCNGCGTPTISVKQRRHLHALMKANPSSFDLTPTYRQHSGRYAPLWNNSITIAAKGVADHVVPRCQGGRTDPSNLTNVCSGCNNSRQHATIDSMGVQAYDRPDTELTFQSVELQQA